MVQPKNLGNWRLEFKYCGSYDILTNTWRTETNLPEIRGGHVAWVAQDKIFVLGRWGGATDEIIVYNPIAATWSYHSQFPTIIGCAGSAILDGKVYVVGGRTSITDDQNHSSRVFAADITPPMDLYYREANASGTITLDKVSTDLAGQFANSTTVSEPVGLVTAVDYNDDVPSGHTILERTDRNATHEWEEMAPVSLARSAYDQVEVLDGKIYFAGGYTNTDSSITESYDPATNQWTLLPSMNRGRWGAASATIGDQFFLIGGAYGASGSSVPLNSVEFFDTKTETWQDSVSLTQTIGQPEAVSFGGKIYLFGGLSEGVFLNHTLEFDPVIGTWIQKSPMPTARAIVPSVVFEDKIWVIGGYNGTSLNNVESYDPFADEWTIETPISVTRHFGTAWVEQGRYITVVGMILVVFIKTGSNGTIRLPGNGHFVVPCPSI